LQAEQRNLKNLIVEMDAETAVRCFYGAVKFADIDDLIIDCLDIMSILENASVSFVKRDGNAVAHSLVCLSLFVGCMVWEGNVPNQIMTCVCKVDRQYILKDQKDLQKGF